jgi:predicted nucleic acid-binding protein
MSFVLDSSIALTWLLPDEGGEADALAERLELAPAIVPAIFGLEVSNALLTAKRRKRLTDKDVDRLLAVLGELPLQPDTTMDHVTLSRTVALAREHGLTSYDAAYLELAQRRDLPLATLDARLREACAQAGVDVLP